MKVAVRLCLISSKRQKMSKAHISCCWSFSCISSALYPTACIVLFLSFCPHLLVEGISTHPGLSCSWSFANLKVPQGWGQSVGTARGQMCLGARVSSRPSHRKSYRSFDSGLLIWFVQYLLGIFQATKLRNFKKRNHQPKLKNTLPYWEQ